MGSKVPAELTLRHPLQHKWILWYLTAEAEKPWEERLRKVAALETVEDFWALHANMVAPSQLAPGADLYLFKEGIQPLWEDPANVNGGRWLVHVGRRQVSSMDDHWLELQLAMIGEQFPGLGKEICGAVVGIRDDGGKVALWTRNAALAEDKNRVFE